MGQFLFFFCWRIAETAAARDHTSCDEVVNHSIIRVVYSKNVICAYVF